MACLSPVCFFIFFLCQSVVFSQSPNEDTGARKIYFLPTVLSTSLDKTSNQTLSSNKLKFNIKFNKNEENNIEFVVRKSSNLNPLSATAPKDAPRETSALPNSTSEITEKPFLEFPTPTSTEGSKMTLDEMLEIWEPNTLQRRWSSWLKALKDPSWGQIGASPDNPSWKLCSEHVADYLNKLRQGNGWAIMLSDASGRAPSGLFDGNEYWLGSRALCHDLDPRNVRQDVPHSSPFHRNDLDPTPLPMAVKAAPFPLSFFVAKIAVNVSSVDLYLKAKLGLCLPASCSSVDVSRLIRSSVLRPDVVRLLKVRKLDQDYQFWKDTVFHILLVTGSLALLLSVSATIYDVYFQETCPEKNLRKKNEFPKGCDVILGLYGVPRSEEERQKTAKSVLSDVIKKDLELDSSPPTSTTNLCQQIVVSFSVKANFKKIMAMEVGEDGLPPVHGLRFLSLLWVILAHASLIMFHLADNKEFRKKAEADFLYQVLSSGTFSVDTFFFISGLLLSYLYFRTCDGQPASDLKDGTIQIGGMMLYRFARLTPPYMFVLGTVQITMTHFNSHSVLELPSKDHETCHRYWWRNLLYINTFFPNSERCMTWSWYLADDTQFYVLGTLILIISLRYFWTAASAIGVFVLSSWLTTAVVAYSAHHVTNYKEPFAQYDLLYDKPWTRIGPYMIGMATGWLLWRTRNVIHIHPILVAIGWTASSATLLGCVFGLYGSTLSPVSSAAFVALSHTAWAVAVAWILVACVSGYGGWVNSVLSWKALFPASRLTYCAYLVHPQLMRIMALHSDNSFHIYRDHVAVLFLGFCLSSFATALVLSLILEAPVVSLLASLRARFKRDVRDKAANDDHEIPPMPESWRNAGFGY